MAVLLSSALVLTPSSPPPPKRSTSSSSRLPGRVGSVRCEAVREGPGRVPGPTVYQGVYGPWSVDQTDAREIIHSLHPEERNLGELEFARAIHILGPERMPDDAHQPLPEMRSQGFQPDCATLSALMLWYAENGMFSEAQALWGEIVSSSFKPSIEVISRLMNTYARMDQFDEIIRIVHETASRDFGFTSQVYTLAISCFGKAGQLQMMEDMIKYMVSRGLKVDSCTGNAFIKYYSMFGTIEEMEAAYGRMKKSRILIEKEAIRAIAHAYISQRKYYKLGEFLRDVGLNRRNTGSLLWNLLLLSYAANFKMKSLQREFLSMVEARFPPDLTTFNVRALAFSRMCMFWDLHLSLEHMKHEKVVPDLVTYGCIVDLYLNRRLGRNLSFALGKLDVDSSPVVATDPLVFEAFGKGDFHSTSEALLESRRQTEWTYSKLISIYLKKKYRISHSHCNILEEEEEEEEEALRNNWYRVFKVHAAMLNVRLKTSKFVSCVRESRAAFRKSARPLKTGKLLTAKAPVLSEATSA